MRSAIVLAAAVLTTWALPLQGQSWPRLTGIVDIDLPRGVIAGDVCLSNLPSIPETGSFILHRGLNVKRVRDGNGKPLPHATEPEPDGVGLRYEVRSPASDSTPLAPDLPRLCVEYVGAFPVYHVEAGDHALSDGSGVVAFNGRTLRARGETRWYPVPYDPATAQAEESMRFQLRVRCSSCERIYLNGTTPLPGPEGEFISDVPREIVIIAGDYPAMHVAGMYLFGEEVAEDTARMFVGRMADIQRFYESYLNVPFGPSIDFARIVPVRYDRPFQMWGFFSDPLMGVAGLRIADFVEVLDDPDHPARPHLLGFLGHELAHRYFPGALGGAHFQLFSEPFANYLGLKATRHFSGEAAYQEGLRALRQRVVEGPDFPSLDRADPQMLGTDPYRYGYASLLLHALEREIGEEQMRRVLYGLLTAPAEEQARADYSFIRGTALRMGVSETDWQRWETECMLPPISQSSCLQDF